MLNSKLRHNPTQPLPLPDCDKCHQLFNESNRAPYIACSKHTICSECLKYLLALPGPNFSCPACSFSRSAPKKKFNEYEIKRDVLNSIQNKSKSARDICTHQECKEKATRLCLDCSEIFCAQHTLDDHEDHKKCKLTGGEMENKSTEKKNLLCKKTKEIEKASTLDSDVVLAVLKAREDELMETYDTITRPYYEFLASQREIFKTDLHNMLVEKAKEKCPEESSDAGLSQWLKNTQILLQQINQKELTDPKEILCYLHKQEIMLEKLDLNNIKNKPTDAVALSQSLALINIKGNDAALQALKKQNLIIINQTVKSENNNSFEEVKCDYFSHSRVSSMTSSSAGKKNIFDEIEPSSPQKLSPPKSSWESSDLPKVIPGSKVDHVKSFKRAFDNKLNIKITKKKSDSILLESISAYGSTGGLRGDGAVEDFNETLKKTELKAVCDKVTDLNLDWDFATNQGISTFSQAIARFPSLQTVRLSFSHNIGIFPINTKFIWEQLEKLDQLDNLTLNFPNWTHLTSASFPFFLSSISRISAKNLSINLLKCYTFDMKGLGEAMKKLLEQNFNLEKLDMKFKECNQLEDDEEALESIFKSLEQASNLKEVTFDFTKCPNLKKESFKMFDNLIHVKVMIHTD